MNRLPEQYQHYIKERIEALNEVFANATIGDFSRNVVIPDEDDIFLQLYIGVQTMLEVIREQISELHELNQTLEMKVTERTQALTEAQRLAHIGNWSWDLITDNVIWSDELYNIFGLTTSEIRPSLEDFLARVYPDDREAVRQRITFSRTHYHSFEFNHRIVRPNGVVRTIHTHGTVLRDNTGRPEKLICTGQDITEQVQSESRFRDLIESAPDALVIVGSDGKINVVNTQTEFIFGYKRDELLGRPVEILLPEEYRSRHTSYRGGYLENPRFRPMGAGLELYGLRKDGTRFPVEISLSPISTQEGRVVSASIRDITERRIAERQIYMLGQTINSMNECVTITDLENNILSVNPAMLKTYGYVETDILGKNVEMLRGSNNPARLTEEVLSSTFKNGWKGELNNRKKNGEEFPVFLSTSVVRDRHGTPIALVGIARDISEQKRIQQQLEEIARQREQDIRYFTASIERAQEEERRRIARELHDGLSQKLSGIKLHLELLTSEVPATGKSLLPRIKKVKKQITDMITETHRISVNLHPSTLDDFGLTVALQILFKEIEQTFKIPVVYRPSITKHDRLDRHKEIAVYRITQEALNNVVKHSKASKVTVILVIGTGGLELTIEDDGVGFEVTRKTDVLPSKRGLGLISMKERTENIGGKFEIISEPGRGTTLHIIIPVQP